MADITRRTMRIVLTVTVIDRAPLPKTANTEEALFHRVINAIVPHPDSVIATEKAGESVNALVTDWEVTS